MFDSNRRQFVSSLAAGLAAAPVSAAAGNASASGLAPSAGVAGKLWIDPALGNLPTKPWRKIHQDFHNSQHIYRIGDGFDADEFGDRLVEANVDGIVVFAKDMHGYFYYPSKYGPVHPGLQFDLLGAQVKACRERGIKVYAYYCATWDHHLAENHQEWLAIKRDRTTYLPKFDEAPGWTALCLAREDFVQLMLDHTEEFVSRYEIDGAWIDMPAPRDGECFCDECLRQLREKDLDPLERRVQHEHKQELLQSYVERTYKTVKAARPACDVEFNAAQGGYGLAERIPFMDNLDIEALPTASWGYYYFPLMTRYMRTLGTTTYGQTGRFQYAWADFGGLKLPAQLHLELAGIVANGAHCAIGDQPPPNARLDPAVYHVIGKAYERIKTLEPYLERAVPVTEAAIVTGGMPMEKPSTPANFGLLKLMLESRVQFDVVEPDPIPLTDVTVRLNLPLGDVAARAVEAGLPLEARHSADGAAEVTVPRVPVSEIVSFEMA